MNDFFGSNDWRTVAVAIALVAFVGTSIVLIATLAAARIFRSRGPALRSAILRAGLVAIVICPLASIALRHAGMPGLKVIPPLKVAPALAQIAPVPQHGAILTNHRPAGGESVTNQNDQQIRRTTIAAMPLETFTLSNVPPAQEKTVAFAAAKPPSRIGLIESTFIALWITVSALLIARLAIANGLIEVIRRRAKPADCETRTKCEAIARQLGVRVPSVLLAPGISGPCLVGWFRPAILLPESGKDVAREILIHELAHLKRQDCAWQLLARFAVALVWFQPLMWIWAREIERAAEEACDDVVLSRDGDRSNYACRLADLAEIAQRRWATAGAGVGVVGMKSSVGRRIVRILNAGNLIPPDLRWRGRLCIALFAAVMAIGLGLIRPAARSMARANVPKAGDGRIARRAGRVLGVDGKPVAGAEVFLVQRNVFEVSALEETHTDAGGNFDLKHSTPASRDNPAQILAFARGKGLGSAPFNPATACELHLLPATQVTLTILGPDGKPVPGLRVFPTDFVSSAFMRQLMSEEGPPAGWRSIDVPAALCQLMSGVTGADGTVTLTDLPREAKFALGFDDDRFAYPHWNLRVPLSDNAPASPPVAFHLEAAASVSGVARFGPAGKPAAGIFVFAQATSRNMEAGGGHALTDENGRYQIKHLGLGEYNVALELDESLQTDWAAAGHEWVAVKPGQNLTDLDFSLIKGGIIAGKVIRADSGQPFAEMRVAAHGPAHPRSSAAVQSVVAAPDGTYTLRVPPGVQYVYMQALLPAAYRQDRQDVREVKVDGGQTVRVDFKMPRREGQLVSGLVIGLDGKPAAGIHIQAQDGQGADEFSYATSDTEGRFRFDALVANTSITVKDGDLGMAEPVTVAQDNGDIKLQLIKRTKLTLGGLITDEHGVPISGARVRLGQQFRSHGIGLGDPLINGPDGRYEIKNLYTDNQYDLAADADGFGEAQAKISWQKNMRELPTLQLPGANATTGGVVVGDDGKPVAGVVVHLNNGMSPKEATTDANGRFSFQIVEGTRHLIWIRIKEEGVVGPNVNASAGRNDLKLVLPKAEQ